MPVYSVNRRRAIILLILSSVLLLTLDLRGNPVFDKARNVFSHVLSPFVTAGDVVATPVKNIWHGATDYRDLRRENEQLRAENALLSGERYTYRASISELKELQALAGLTANYNRVTARVVGDSTSNFRQTVEIDRGKRAGIQVGMAVVNLAGLVGKITSADDDRAIVLLVTDREYAIECKVSGIAPEVSVPEPADDDAPEQDPTDGSAVPGDGDEESTTGTEPGFGSGSSTTTTQPGFSETADTIGGDEGDDGSDGSDDDDRDGTTTTTGSTTTSSTTPPIVQRETGGCEGRGLGALPVMKFVSENPLVGTIGEGDIVSTAGGSGSLVPPDIIIGPVVNKIQRAGSAGPLLEIDLAADLDNLGLVQVVLYTASSEVPG